MPTVGSIVRSAQDVVGRGAHIVTHAARHPVATASQVVGKARHLAGSAINGKPDRPRVAIPPDAPTEVPEEVAPTMPNPPVMTEPHVDAGDDWRDEIGPDEDETDAGPQRDTEPLMDPSLTKAVKSGSETLQRAAETHKE
jgi:hypothetical protein